MGCPKFYRTPVGRIRARTLAQTGEHYDPTSIEFKLISRHYITEDRYKADTRHSDFLKWAYLIQVVSTADQNSLQQVIERVKKSVNNTTLRYLAPAYEDKDEQEREEITHEDKVKFLETVGNRKFSGLNEIFTTLRNDNK